MHHPVVVAVQLTTLRAVAHDGDAPPHPVLDPPAEYPRVGRPGDHRERPLLHSCMHYISRQIDKGRYTKQAVDGVADLPRAVEAVTSVWRTTGAIAAAA